MENKKFFLDITNGLTALSAKSFDISKYPYSLYVNNSFHEFFAYRAYQIIRLKSSNKSEIISELSNWILTQLFGPIDASKYAMEGNIIVSFFIQNCEVFEA